MTGAGGRKVAVVGAGIAGLGAALALSRTHDVVLFEAERRAGGHSATVDIDYHGAPIAVDTGFIVYNTLNYPMLTRLFAHLGVATKPSEMSFSVSARGGGFEWAGHERRLWKLFAQPSNALDPGFWRMLADVARFGRIAPRDLAAGALEGLSLGEYLARRGLSDRFRDGYLLPMGAAIWSTPAAKMLDFPAESFVAFFENHRLLGFDRPVWRTVEGGSRAYVSAILARLGEGARLGAPVMQVRRDAGGVEIVLADGARARFDAAVLATHADETLRLIAAPSEAERAVLGAVRFSENHVFLHRDASLMPKRRAAWSAWNTLAGGERVAVTYWMNALQGVDPARPLFVSLNPPRPPAEALTFARFRYAHPEFDAGALAAQARLPEIQGADRLWFAGAWTGNGFHEAGLVSGLAAAEALGAAAPWADAMQAPERAAA
jgi:predicted NAD/FAD-binding protein